jgi:hypothetical protein
MVEASSCGIHRSWAAFWSPGLGGLGSPCRKQKGQWKSESPTIVCYIILQRSPAMLLLFSFVLNASADPCPGYTKACGNGPDYCEYSFFSDRVACHIFEDGAASVTVLGFGGTTNWLAIVEAPSGNFCCHSNDTTMPYDARNGLAYFGVFAEGYTGPLTVDLQAVDGGTSYSTMVLGSEGDDTIAGSDDTSASYGDLIFGYGGNDYIDGGAGSDNIFGDDDSDRIHGGGGADTIDVGLGCNDQAFGAQENDTITGSSTTGCTTADHLEGGPGDDTIYAGDGDDDVCGHGGIDTLNGEGGVDYVWGGADVDTIDGGGTTNSCQVNSGPDTYTNCSTLITSYCPIPPAWP